MRVCGTGRGMGAAKKGDGDGTRWESDSDEDWFRLRGPGVDPALLASVTGEAARSLSSRVACCSVSVDSWLVFALDVGWLVVACCVSSYAVSVVTGDDSPTGCDIVCGPFENGCLCNLFELDWYSIGDKGAE